MTEFLHQVIANREWRQHDIELQRALREQILNATNTLSFTDPWIREEVNNGEL